MRRRRRLAWCGGRGREEEAASAQAINQSTSNGRRAGSARPGLARTPLVLSRPHSRDGVPGEGGKVRLCVVGRRRHTVFFSLPFGSAAVAAADVIPRTTISLVYTETVLSAIVLFLIEECIRFYFLLFLPFFSTSVLARFLRRNRASERLPDIGAYT